MTETEIKLPIDDVPAIKRRLRRLGWRVARRRHDEKNVVYDRPDQSLFAAGYLLRVRQVGKRCWLTVKGPEIKGAAHKVREEYEIETRGFSTLTKILETLGFVTAWCYEKRRTTYHSPGEAGEILLDETPIGYYLELEGEASWIDRTAGKLGFRPSDYITLSYRKLFEQHRETAKGTNPDMVFEGREHRNERREGGRRYP